VTLHVFAGGIATETNVFSPMPTGLRDFAVAQPDDSQEVRDRLSGGSCFSAFAAVAVSRGCLYTQGSYAYAEPAGVTPRAAYETLRDSLLREVEKALPIDCVLLNLHGAMVAEGHEDCETDILLQVRRIVGDQAKIGILLDLHCDLPESLVEQADVLITYKEYPHIDADERARELARLVIDAAIQRVDPQMAVFDCRMIGLYPTSHQPMRGFVDRMREAERQPKILSVSLGHGFPWGDAPAMGARILVVADGDMLQAQALATEFGREFHSLRHKVTLKPLPMAAALDRALSLLPANGPIVVADVSDNPGGGAPGDSTFVLRELIRLGINNAAVALLWDPIAVQQAFAAGADATLTLRLGGKMGPSSGDPLDLAVLVRGVVPGLVQLFPQINGYDEVPCGDCACLTVAGIDVIVSSLRSQVLGLQVFTEFGINPADRDLLVVKSANHFLSAFAPIAREIIYMGAAGALIFDPRSIPYHHLDTNKFPLVDDQCDAE